MKRYRPELADIVRKHGEEYLEAHKATVSFEQRRVLRSIAECRTSVLGGHKTTYSCGHEDISYNSCRDRHCPKCQGDARRKWLDQRAAELLDVEYFHVVFTLPDALGPVALQNKRELYGLLFQAASETLLTIARDPKHLGAEIGFLAVLHTWGQNLHMHPHVHCVVPGGGFSRDKARWVSCRKGFFLSVKVLGRLFRRKFIALLRNAEAKGKIQLHGKLSHLSGQAGWEGFLRSIDKRDWVVYAKPPFGGAQQVLKYLARYTQRVAIGNDRIVRLEDGGVTFKWKDYAHGNAQREMKLEALEFIRRFLQHVLPKGFMRIRCYGFLAHRFRRNNLELARKLLATKPEETTIHRAAQGLPESAAEEPRDDREVCPKCKQGHVVSIEEILPSKGRKSFSALPVPIDTS
jgi:hypothetical protein